MSKYKKIEEEILSLHNQGIRPTAIQKQLGIPKSSYLHLRRKLNLESRAIKAGSINLDEYTKSVLIGTILGDSYVGRGSTTSASFSFAHCSAQKKYFDYKIGIFKNFEGSIQEQNYFDKRTSKTYKRYCYCSKSFKELKEIRELFYVEGKKRIPINYLKENFTIISLAVLYMDDGSTQKYNTIISTQSFLREDLEEFVTLLKEKFDLDFTIQKGNTIRVKQKDVAKFKVLVKDEVSKVSSMIYKLN